MTSFQWNLLRNGRGSDSGHIPYALEKAFVKLAPLGVFAVLGFRQDHR
jgi:hypothetical protein